MFGNYFGMFCACHSFVFYPSLPDEALRYYDKITKEEGEDEYSI